MNELEMSQCIIDTCTYISFDVLQLQHVSTCLLKLIL